MMNEMIVSIRSIRQGSHLRMWIKYIVLSLDTNQEW